MRYSGKVEYAQARKIRERNTGLYRLAALAYMDMGVFSGARPSDLYVFCAWV